MNEWSKCIYFTLSIFFWTHTEASLDSLQKLDTDDSSDTYIWGPSEWESETLVELE